MSSSRGPFEPVTVALRWNVAVGRLVLGTPPELGVALGNPCAVIKNQQAWMQGRQGLQDPNCFSVCA